MTLLNEYFGHILKFVAKLIFVSTDPSVPEVIRTHKERQVPGRSAASELRPPTA